MKYSFGFRRTRWRASRRRAFSSTAGAAGLSGWWPAGIPGRRMLRPSSTAPAKRLDARRSAPRNEVRRWRCEVPDAQLGSQPHPPVMYEAVRHDSVVGYVWGSIVIWPAFVEKRVLRARRDLPLRGDTTHVGDTLRSTLVKRIAQALEPRDGRRI